MIDAQKRAVRNFQRILLIAVLACTAAGGCTPSQPPSDAGQSQGPPTVYTTFYPTTYFAERIGGEHVNVVCPLPEDADPIFWMPPPEVIEEYQSADLIVVHGAEFEKWVAKVSLPFAKMVDVSQPLQDELLNYEGVITHSHGPAGEHSHEGIDGHVWLDPNLARVQADQIRAAFVTLAGEHAERFDANYQSLVKDLEALDDALSQLSNQLDERPLLASHPAYNYVARQYGWNITNLDLDPQRLPGESELVELRERVEQSGAGILLWESAPRAEVAERLEKELGLESVVFSPCEQLSPAEREAGRDYLDVMYDNIQRLRQVISDEH